MVTSCSAGRAYLNKLSQWRSTGSSALETGPDGAVIGGIPNNATGASPIAGLAMSRLRASSGAGGVGGGGSGGSGGGSGGGGSGGATSGVAVPHADAGAGDIIATVMPSTATTGAQLMGTLEALIQARDKAHVCRQLLVCLDFSGMDGDGEAITEACRSLLRTWMLSRSSPAHLRLCVGRGVAWCSVVLRLGLWFVCCVSCWWRHSC